MDGDVTRRRFLAGAGAGAVCAIGAGAGARAGSADAGGGPAHRGEGVVAESDARDERRAGGALESFVDGRMAALLEEAGADGAAVAVVHDGELALAKGYGHAFHSPDHPVEADATPFRIGSVSKVVAYAAAMQLVDRGVVDPDEDVTTYLESVSVPDTYDEPVTLAHLATHAAGFEERAAGNIYTDPGDVPPLAEALAVNDPARVRPPGELPAYTNYNAALAGQLVADAAGTSFEEYVRTNVFEPLGMTGSSFAPAPPELIPAPDTDVADAVEWYSGVPPASGMTATAADVGTFARALVGDGTVDGDRLFSAGATESFRRQWDTPHERLAGAAFGMERHRRDGTLVLRHGGGVPNFASDLLLVPEAGLGLFVSVHGDAPFGPEESFVDAFLERFVPVGAPDLAPVGRPARADELAGSYRSVHVADAASYDKPLLALVNRVADVRIADDGGLVTEIGGETDRWVEVEPLVFRRVDGAERLVFRTEGGAVTHLFLGRDQWSPLEAVGPHERASHHALVAAVAAVVLLSALLGWPLRALWERVRSGAFPAGPRRPWLVGSAAAAWPFAFAVGVLVLVASGGLYDPPRWLVGLFAIPVAGLLATAWALAEGGRAWRDGRWTRVARGHYAAVVAASSVLLWLLHYWNVLGGRL